MGSSTVLNCIEGAVIRGPLVQGYPSPYDTVDVAAAHFILQPILFAPAHNLAVWPLCRCCFCLGCQAVSRLLQSVAESKACKRSEAMQRVTEFHHLSPTIRHVAWTSRMYYRAGFAMPCPSTMAKANGTWEEAAPTHIYPLYPWCMACTAAMKVKWGLAPTRAEVRLVS